MSRLLVTALSALLLTQTTAFAQAPAQMTTPAPAQPQSGVIAAPPPVDIFMEVTTGPNGEPVLSKDEFDLVVGGYYRFNFVCPDAKDDATGFHFEANNLLENSHLRVVSIGDIEVYMQGLSSAPSNATKLVPLASASIQCGKASTKSMCGTTPIRLKKRLGGLSLSRTKTMYANTRGWRVPSTWAASLAVRASVVIVGTMLALGPSLGFDQADVDELMKSKHCFGCDFGQVELESAQLADAYLTYSNFNGARLAGIDLSGAYIRFSSMENADVTGGDLRGADLWDSRLAGIILVDVDLQGAAFEGSNMRGADLTEADLKDANMKDTNLRDAKLVNASLVGANLSGASLRGSDLTGADLTNAQLDKTGLREANLTDAVLTGASTTNSNMSGAVFCRTTMPTGEVNSQGCS